MKYKVSIEFESDKANPLQAALELSEAVANGESSYYTVTELKTGAKFGVSLSDWNGDEDEGNAVHSIAE